MFPHGLFARAHHLLLPQTAEGGTRAAVVGKQVGVGWGWVREPSWLGSWRPESAGRQAGRAQSSQAWGGDGAGMFLPPRPGPCPPHSGSCTLMLQPQLWLRRWEMPGTLLSRFSQGPSEAAWPWGLTQGWARPGQSLMGTGL